MLVPEVPVQSAPFCGVAIPECRSPEAKSSEKQPFSICLEEALDTKESSDQNPFSDVLSASAHAPVMVAMTFCPGVHTVEQVCSSQNAVGSPEISAGSGDFVATDPAVVSWRGEIVERDAAAEAGLSHFEVYMPSMSFGSNSLVSIDDVTGAQKQIVFGQASENIGQEILADVVKGTQLSGDVGSEGLYVNSSRDVFSKGPGVSVVSPQQPLTEVQFTSWFDTALHPPGLQVLEEVESRGSEVGGRVLDDARVVTQKSAAKDSRVVGRQSDLSWQQQPAFGATERAADLVRQNQTVQEVPHVESSTLHHLGAPTVVADSEDLASTSDQGKESVEVRSASRDGLSDHSIRCAFSALSAGRSELANYRLSETPTLVNATAGTDFPVRLISQVVRAIALRRSDDRTEILIRLHPPELGSVAVRVVQDTQGLSSHINTSTEEVCNLFQSHLPLLKNALLEAGVNLSSVTVSHDSSLNNMLGSPANQSWDHQDGSLYQGRRAFHAGRGSSEGMIGGSDWMVFSAPTSSPVDSARYTWLA